MARIYEKIEPRLVSIEDQNKDTSMWESSSRFSEFSDWLGSVADAKIADYYWRLLVYVRTRPRTLVVRFSPWIFLAEWNLPLHS